MRQLAMGVLQYTQDYDESFPMHDITYPYFLGTEWQIVIYPYVKSKPVYRCPDDIQPDIDTTNPRDIGTADALKTPVSYKYNPMLGCDFYPLVNAVRTMSVVSRPSNLILLMEGYNETHVPATATTGTRNVGVDMDGIKSIWLNDFTINPANTGYVTGGASACKKLPRHAGNMGGNFAFVDGHVKYYSYRGGAAKLQQVLPIQESLYTDDDQKYVGAGLTPEWDANFDNSQCGN